MITLKGKYNSANVMIDSIDSTTKEQIHSFLNHPAFTNTYIAVMPDCHAGKGAVVGLTMKLNEYVIPNIIGVDIGCGMLSAKYNIESIDREKLDLFIKQNIPSGFHINSNYDVSKDLKNEIVTTCKMIGIDSEKALRAIGSLGGGNHFIEAGFNPTGKLFITIHSGSRNFGKCVAEFYQKKAKAQNVKRQHKDSIKDLEYMSVHSDDATDYFYALTIAQKFASENRKTMMLRIHSFLNKDPEETIESVHNYIGDDDIIRKGATSARKGETVIIPFNMRDGIALCKGKGSSKYNNSAPHGAGRILSRTQAKKQLLLSDFQTQMKNADIYTTTANKDTLDEAPDAYKDKEIILANISETVEIQEFIKPVYNFKSCGN